MPSESSRRSSRGKPIKSIEIICESPFNLPLAKSAAKLLQPLVKPLKVKVSGNPFLSSSKIEDELSEAFIRTRLIDSYNREARAVDSFALRDFEKRVMTGESRARGVPYEGTELLKTFQSIPGIIDGFPERVCAILTDRLAMTWSEDDLRYHARVAVFGFPSIISISGLIEAPARPREYYLAKQALDLQGKRDTEAVLSNQFAGRYLEQDDKRTVNILRGYLMQCLFYSDGLEPFCGDRDCMLFNAHWQEEMIHAQIESGKLCDKHTESLGRILKGRSAIWSGD